MENLERDARSRVSTAFPRCEMELVSELHTSREDMGQKSQQSPDEPCEERLFCRPHWPCFQGDRDALMEPSLVRCMPVGSGMMEPQEPTGTACPSSCCRRQLSLPWQGVKVLLPQWLPGEDVFSFTNTHKEIQNAFNLKCVPPPLLDPSPGRLGNT